MKKENRNELEDYLFIKFGITRDQFDNVADYIHDLLTSCYTDSVEEIKTFIGLFQDDINLLTKWIYKYPNLYNYLENDLKRKEEVIKAAIEGKNEAVFMRSEEIFLDFYEVIKGEKDKIAAYRSVFANLDCRDDILERIIIQEYLCDDTVDILNAFKEFLLKNVKLLVLFMRYCGLQGFLIDYKDDFVFFKKILKLEPKLILLASDSLKRNRELLNLAISKEPELAFVLKLENDVEYLSVAINGFRKKFENDNEFLFMFKDDELVENENV